MVNYQTQWIIRPLLDILTVNFFVVQVHVLAMEYPGYGVYDGEPNAD